MYRTILDFKRLLGMILALLLCFAPQTWAGKGSGGSTTPPPTQVYDTSFAVEYSYSCLTGGCHEINTTLLNGYKASYMTHVMVKCNACHGTHTAAEVGQPKPNLTGYVAGKGATGYKVPKDRCLACHSAAPQWMQQQSSCTNCHHPHVFAKPW
jgi:hypothetical protein